MSEFKVTVLGCGSAMPSKHHLPSAQLVTVNGNHYICDAGECLQYSLYHNHIGYKNVKGVFITHLHGDHCFGLIGYLMKIAVEGRKEDFHIYGPDGLEKFIRQQIEIMCPNMPFVIQFHVVSDESVIYEDKYITVESVRLNHKTTDCFGYIFREKPRFSLHINREAFEKYGIELRNGKDVKYLYMQHGPEYQYEYEFNKFCRLGDIVDAEEYTGKSFAYCTDNSFDHIVDEDGNVHSVITEDTHLVQKLKNVDVLYHEASYITEQIGKAIQYMHSTAAEAATLAKLATVECLIIGHLSARYQNENVVLEEAQSIFPNTYLADENEKFNLSL